MSPYREVQPEAKTGDHMADTTKLLIWGVLTTVGLIGLAFFGAAKSCTNDARCRDTVFKLDGYQHTCTPGASMHIERVGTEEVGVCSCAPEAGNEQDGGAENE